MTRPLDSAPEQDVRGCFELRFRSLTAAENDLSFPCSAQGLVDMNALSVQARENYLFARALVGRSFSPPLCMECAPQ